MKVALLSSSLSKKGGGVAEVVLRLGQNLIKLPIPMIRFIMVHSTVRLK